MATVLHLPRLYALSSYSQEGEDLVLRKLFDGRNSGFYVDIGAHHPYRYSNTFALYQRGWRGINIDATPGVMTAFRKARPGDINLEIAIGTSLKNQPYYCFADGAFNTFSNDAAEKLIKSGQSTLVKTVKIMPQKLSDVLKIYLPAGTNIDFINLDAEGRDEDVLLSNNWKKFRPEIISAEVGSSQTVTAIERSPIAKLLRHQGYSLYSRLFNTAFFKRLFG